MLKKMLANLTFHYLHDDKYFYFWNAVIPSYVLRHSVDVRRVKTIQQLQADVMRDLGNLRNLDKWNSTRKFAENMSSFYSLCLNLEMLCRVVIPKVSRDS